MRLAGAAVLSFSLGITWWALFHHDHMRIACFDAGRVIGGAEQRVFSSKANGDEPLDGDVSTATKGAPEACR